VAVRFTKDVAKRFNDDIRFVKTLVGNPKAMGAVWPTSNVTAKRMASVINPTDNTKVLELGPGTGVITNAIIERGVKPHNIFSVEYTSAFLPQLRKKYPGVNFIHGDAFNLDTLLSGLEPGLFDAALSGLPLLNFPTNKRVDLLQSAFKWLQPGRPFVQFSYGPASPLPPDPASYRTESLEWILRNIPPARIWTYQQSTDA